MAEIIAIASGKGGVGKSFVASSLSIALNAAGYKVLLVDADLGGANLHNFLGFKVPPIGIYNFLREKAELDNIISKTPIGVDFIAGSGDVLGMAHISKLERSRFTNKLKTLDYNYIIMDLGAGTSFNTVDMFNLADKKILVMNSEPTSIENAYGFLKVALYRHIERILSVNEAFEEVNKKLRSKSLSFPSVDAVLEVVSAIDQNMAEIITQFVRGYRVGVVLNMVRFRKELNVFYGFENIVKKYMRISVEKLGFIPYDNKVSECVRTVQPFYAVNSGSGTASCINDIRSQMLIKL